MKNVFKAIGFIIFVMLMGFTMVACDNGGGGSPNSDIDTGFIGSSPMNFLSVKVIDEGGSITLDEGSFKIKANPSHLEFLRKYATKEVFFSIRPEDLNYSQSEPPNSMSLKVTAIEPLGDYIHLWLTTGTQSLVARTEPSYSFKIGDTAVFVPKMEKACCFDKETGLAITPSPFI